MQSSTRVLDPNDRISEGLFGLIMVLTFTGSLSIAEAGRDDVRTMLIGALGCNLAWGVIDAVMYLMGCLAERSRVHRLFRGVREAEGVPRVRQALASELPGLADLLEEPELAALQQRVQRMLAPPAKPGLTAEDCRGAVGVFLLVFLTTLPVAIPFLFMHEVGPALRVSNGVAIVMLFALGSAYGRVVGRHPWWSGLAMVLVGMALVGMTMALGG